MGCDWCERPVGASHAATCPLKGYVTEPAAPSEGGTGDEIAKLRSEITRLREERRWVPVGERLPLNSRAVIANVPSAYGPQEASFRDGKWYDGFGVTRHPVTHWQPLPPGPETKEVPNG